MMRGWFTHPYPLGAQKIRMTLPSGADIFASEIVARRKRRSLCQKWTDGGVYHSGSGGLRGGCACLKQHDAIFFYNRLERWPLPRSPKARHNRRIRRRRSASRSGPYLLQTKVSIPFWTTCKVKPP